MLSEGELAAILSLNRETPALEFKGPGRRDDNAFVARVTRGILAMTNRRDGGLIVVGVEETDNGFNPVGLSTDERKTWENEDALADRVAAYADPSVKFTVAPQTMADGKAFVVLEVEEFDSVPVICRKSFDDILADGALYVRPRRKPESVPVRTAADMRDVIELASEKELRRYVTRAQRARVDVIGGPTDYARYDEQLGSLE